MSDITVLGIFVADISFSGNKLPTTGETILGDSYNIGPGGKGCNQAIAISRLGGNVNFISKLGNDDYGKLAIDKLKKDSIDTSNIIISNAHKNLQDPDASIRKPTVKAVANAFASRGLNQDLREIKNDKEFVLKREEILSMIWDMEEEIMGKEIG